MRPQACNATGPSLHAGFGPADLQCAYGLVALSASAGAGRTVVVLANDDTPELEANLATYRAAYGLPPCTTANGCFHKVSADGNTTLPKGLSGGGEYVVDSEMISALCPLCNITVLEAGAPSPTSMDLGVQNVVPKLPGVASVTVSLGWRETPGNASKWALSGIPVFAASGDSGYPGTQAYSPSDYPTVIAVGGTSLARAATARGWTESAWNGSGSVCSAVIAKPAWQKDQNCSMRMVADAALVGDPATGMAYYHLGQGETGWGIVGGTSISAPGMAAIYALVGRAVSDASTLYANPTALYDITMGSNGTCAVAYLCTAGAGYDGPTGMGTPNVSAPNFLSTF